jgi:hypothetical protein
MATKISQKNAKKFVCEKCDFGSCNKHDYERHLLTLKHKNNALSTGHNNFEEKNIKKYECENCCKCFNDRSGLWRHKKKCSKEIINLKNELSNEKKQKDLIDYLLKENSEFKQLMIEQNKTMIELAKNTGFHNNSHNTTNNTNNNFNINFYLNETCKNAMNIMDFVSQLPVSIKHLEDTGRLGFAEGISKIFIDGLKQINVTDRPIHCSDLKRETLYIKDNNEWNKETDNKIILTNAIKHVAHKNIKQISEWTKIYPDCTNSESKKNDKYLKIVSESMSGSSEEESKKNYSKIIKNIVKETFIDKSNEVLFNDVP